MNKAIILGNLGRDPEVRSTSGGSSVCNLRIATTERRKDRDGNWGDHTEWHAVVCFGRTADNAGRFLSKGRQVLVEGRLQTRKWTDKDGTEKWSTEIVADTLTFVGGKGDGGQRDTGSGSGRSYGGSSGGGYSGGGDDDIPF